MNAKSLGDKARWAAANVTLPQYDVTRWRQKPNHRPFGRTSARAIFVWNDPSSYVGQLQEILANPILFGSDLTQTVLAGKIEEIFVKELAGTGSVRATLHKYLA